MGSVSRLGAGHEARGQLGPDIRSVLWYRCGSPVCSCLRSGCGRLVMEDKSTEEWERFFLATAIAVVMMATAGWVLSMTVAPEAVNMAIGCTICIPLLIVAYLLIKEDN